MNEKIKSFFSSGIGILLILLIVRNLLNGRYSDPKDFIYNTLILLPGIIIGLSFHEFGHAFVSYKLGDPTPMRQGRVTLNPAAHIDPTGFIALIFCGFGWGKPVQIDPSYYKNRRRDELLVSLAGVFNNLIIAVVFSFILKIYISSVGLYQIESSTILNILLDMLLYVVQINVVLMIFNLIPVPPLDGFGVVTQLFDLRSKDWYYKIYQYGPMIMMIMLITGAVGMIISPLVSGILDLLIKYIVMS